MNYFRRFLKAVRDFGVCQSTKALIATAVIVSFGSGNAFAANPFGIYITKFCSDTGNGQKFEFVQFTNLGSASVDMTNWSEDDIHGTSGVHSLAGLGTLAPGQVGVLTEATPSDFETYWWGSPANAPANFKVTGPYTTDSLSTTANDSITLFNGATLEDRIDYTAIPANRNGDSTVRNCPSDAVGLNNNALWVNSALNDQFGSFRASGISPFTGILGNPAVYIVPEPGTLSIAVLCALPSLSRRRRAKA